MDGKPPTDGRPESSPRPAAMQSLRRSLLFCSAVRRWKLFHQEQHPAASCIQSTWRKSNDEREGPETRESEVRAPNHVDASTQHEAALSIQSHRLASRDLSNNTKLDENNEPSTPSKGGETSPERLLQPICLHPFATPRKLFRAYVAPGTLYTVRSTVRSLRDHEDFAHNLSRGAINSPVTNDVFLAMQLPMLTPSPGAVDHQYDEKEEESFLFDSPASRDPSVNEASVPDDSMPAHVPLNKPEKACSVLRYVVLRHFLLCFLTACCVLVHMTATVQFTDWAHQQKANLASLLLRAFSVNEPETGAVPWWTPMRKPPQHAHWSTTMSSWCRETLVTVEYALDEFLSQLPSRQHSLLEPLTPEHIDCPGARPRQSGK